MRILLPLSIVLLFLSCCGDQPASLAGQLPATNAVPGWALADAPRLYSHDNLFDMVDGQADAFFVYGFEHVIAQRYQSSAGTILEVDLWQLATPADAYGLFTSGIAGDPAQICPPTNAARCYDGDIEPGRRLSFWQDRYYVQVYGRRQLDGTDLQAFAVAVSRNLPDGSDRPALLNRLPQNGLIERKVLFFHEEISIQNQIWLGGKNILGLSPQTDGLLARYERNGATLRMLLIEYPSAEAASAGAAALRGNDQVKELNAVAAQGKLLGAVFGQAERAIAEEILAQSLRGENERQ